MMTTTSSLVNFPSAGHVVVVVVLFVIIGGQTSDGWPLGGAALYQCCCEECRRECFSCRNSNYTCNCADCSCYASSQPELVDAQTLIEKLFRTYSSQNRDRAKPRRQQQQQQQHHHHHHRPPSERQRLTKVHGRHGNGSHVATVEGQDANRTKKRPAPPVDDPGNHQVREKHPVT